MKGTQVVLVCKLLSFLTQKPVLATYLLDLFSKLWVQVLSDDLVPKP